MEEYLISLQTYISVCACFIYICSQYILSYTDISVLRFLLFLSVFSQTFVGQPVNKKSLETGLKWNYIF